MIFSATCWHGWDQGPPLLEDDEEDDEPSNAALPNLQYCISIFGRDEHGRSVCVTTEFSPFFYVRVPDHWCPSDVTRYIKRFERLYPVKRRCELVTHTEFRGFTNGEQHKFLRLAFSSHKYCRWAQRQARRQPPSPAHALVYQGNVEPRLQLLHARDLKPAGWIEVTSPSQISPCDRLSTCEVEVRCDWTALRPAPSPPAHPPPLVVCSWDLECMSLGEADDPSKPIIQAGCTFQTFGQGVTSRHVLVLGPCDPVPGVEIESFDTEAAMLTRFCGLLREKGTDVLVGYNTWQYDEDYLFKRATLLDLDLRLGRLLDHPMRLDTLKLASNAYGSNEFKVLPTPGWLQVDLLVLLKKEAKFESYKLGVVAAHYLGGDTKDDVTVRQILDSHTGTPADRARIAHYCSVDCELPLRIMQKIGTLEGMTEMANAVLVPLEFLLPRGQQIRAFSQITKKCSDMGYLVPVLEDDQAANEDGYVGATVLQPKRGVYYDPVAALDFASLYPSIMRAHNTCHSTVVLDAKYDNLPGVEYFDVQTDRGAYRFAQGVPAVLPALLEELSLWRKKAKREMAAAKERGDSFQASVLNARQLAYKVSMNSVYGFCGATRGYLPCVPIAASVTAVGRAMIEHTKRMVERDFDGEVVYGDTDSVMVRFNAGDKLADHFRVATEAAEAITATFRKPNELEMEKVYWPYILYSKKRYAGVMYTKPEAPDYLDIKGLSMIRRDSCKLVRETCDKALRHVMYDRDTELAVAAVQRSALALMEGRVPMADLVLSKTLKDTYATQSFPHLHVAKQMEARTPGAGPRSGDRVPYVVVRTGDPLAKNWEKAEDPEYVALHGVPLDTAYYLENQMTNPLVSLLAPVLSSLQDDAAAEKETQAILFGTGALGDCIRAAKKRAAEELKVHRRKSKNAKNNQREITSFFRQP